MATDPLTGEIVERPDSVGVNSLTELLAQQKTPAAATPSGIPSAGGLPLNPTQPEMRTMTAVPTSLAQTAIQPPADQFNLSQGDLNAVGRPGGYAGPSLAPGGASGGGVVRPNDADPNRLEINYGSGSPWALYSPAGNETPWSRAKYMPTTVGWRPLFQQESDRYVNYYGPQPVAGQQPPWWANAQQYRSARAGDTVQGVGQVTEDLGTQYRVGPNQFYEKFYMPLVSETPAVASPSQPNPQQGWTAPLDAAGQPTFDGNLVKSWLTGTGAPPDGFSLTDSPINQQVTQPLRIIQSPGGSLIVNTQTGQMVPDATYQMPNGQTSTLTGILSGLLAAGVLGSLFTQPAGGGGGQAPGGLSLEQFLQQHGIVPAGATSAAAQTAGDQTPGQSGYEQAVAAIDFLRQHQNILGAAGEALAGGAPDPNLSPVTLADQLVALRQALKTSDVLAPEGFSLTGEPGTGIEGAYDLGPGFNAENFKRALAAPTGTDLTTILGQAPAGVDWQTIVEGIKATPAFTLSGAEGGPILDASQFDLGDTTLDLSKPLESPTSDGTNVGNVAAAVVGALNSGLAFLQGNKAAGAVQAFNATAQAAASGLLGEGFRQAVAPIAQYLPYVAVAAGIIENAVNGEMSADHQAVRAAIDLAAAVATTTAGSAAASAAAGAGAGAMGASAAAGVVGAAIAIVAMIAADLVSYYFFNDKSHRQRELEDFSRLAGQFTGTLRPAIYTAGTVDELASALGQAGERNFQEDYGSLLFQAGGQNVNTNDRAALLAALTQAKADPALLRSSWNQGLEQQKLDQLNQGLDFYVRQQLALIRAAELGDPRAVAELARRKQQGADEQVIAGIVPRYANITQELSPAGLQTYSEQGTPGAISWDPVLTGNSRYTPEDMERLAREVEFLQRAQRYPWSEPGYASYNPHSYFNPRLNDLAAIVAGYRAAQQARGTAPAYAAFTAPGAP